ncbi:hypothetical protein [Dendronalium sp. ChiSLP03b]|nr:hypothetical protein [Dendronalium sp. ChiSLP03b]MDZ8203679.1 hypothetical protein [Dendronalium sp. ChiSLP03b]
MWLVISKIGGMAIATFAHKHNTLTAIAVHIEIDNFMPADWLIQLWAENC